MRTRVAIAVLAALSMGAGSGSAGSGSAGSGSAGSGSAGSDEGKQLQLPLGFDAPEVRAAASPTVVRLGARFTLYVTATFGPGVEVNLREPIDLGAAFEVRRKTSEDRTDAIGRTVREWQLDVTPWELGDLQIAPIAVTFTSHGKPGQVPTNAVPLKIVGTLGDIVDDPRAVRGLAPPAALWARDWFWIWCASAGGAIAGVIACALWLRARRRRRHRIRLVGTAAHVPALDMTSERALERLLGIERSGVLARDATRKLGYAELVEVVRAYLGARYRLAVHDCTSSELVAQLATVAPAHVEHVARWLDACDLVKYGGQRASEAHAREALADARAIIVETSPRAEAA